MTLPRIPPWRWNLWGPWPPDGSSPQEAPATDDAIRARADQISKRRPWCTAEQNWADARLELNSPVILRWRPTLLRWLGASEKTGWDWMDLLIKLSVPLTVALGGWLLGTINSNRQNEIAQANQKDAAVREYIKEMKEMLLDKAVADEAKTPGSSANGVARALTLTALTQLKGEEPERRNLVFQFLRESNFPVLAGSSKAKGANLARYDLRRTDLSRSALEGVIISEANLSSADLGGANLRGGSLQATNLSEANLEEANLSRANLLLANLKGVNLQSANLKEASLIMANLKGGNLYRANLSGADLRRTGLMLANLYQSNLSGADLSGADLRRANIENLRWDDKTIWPSRDRFEGAKNIPPALKKQLGL